MPITEFLKKPSNSLIREEILNYGLLFDLKIAAATKNQQLKIYRPEVDMDGFDIIFEDATDFSRKIQIKSRVNSTTSRWNDIHRNILLPAMSQSEDYGFDTICPFTPGGFLLIDIVKTQDNITRPIQLEYYYTDINIISLLALGYITEKNNSRKKAKEVLKDLQTNPFAQKTITITQILLIKLKDADALLKILGLLGQLDFIFNAWKLNQLFYRKSIYFGAIFVEPDNNDKDYWSWFEEQGKNAERGHKLQIEEIFKEIQFKN